MRRLDVASLDLAEFIRAGDRVVCGQVSAEPLALTRALCAARPRIGDFETFVGTLIGDSFDAAPQDMRFASYGAMARGARLARRNPFDVWPMHYSALEAAFASGDLRCDVALIQLAQGPGGLRVALANDYVLAAARHARCVIAQVNARAPACASDGAPDFRIDALVESDEEPASLGATETSAVDAAIARNVAAHIGDGATLQIGVGAIPDTVLATIGDRRDLGLHSGVFSDRVAELRQSGALTGARKSLDPGVAVTNTIVGSRVAFDAIDGARDVALRPAAYTHSPVVLARQSGLIAVNSVIEVDLTGQANAERADGAPVGGTGGLCDFSRGARSAPGGSAIIALRATDRSGGRSRIVPRVEAVTLARTDVDVVVTEYGAAEIGRLGAAGRAKALIAIAAPQHREALERSLREARPS